MSWTVVNLRIDTQILDYFSMPAGKTDIPLSVLLRQNFRCCCWLLIGYLRNPGTNDWLAAGPNGVCSLGPDITVRVADRHIGQDFVLYSTWTRWNTS